MVNLIKVYRYKGWFPSMQNHDLVEITDLPWFDEWEVGSDGTLTLLRHVGAIPSSVPVASLQRNGWCKVVDNTVHPGEG